MFPSQFKCLSENLKFTHNEKSGTLESKDGVKVYVKNFGS